MNDFKRSASFLARAGGLYLSYKVSQVNIGTSALVGRWGEERVEQAWHRVNDRGGREVRVLAEDFQGYYLKCAQWLGARPDLVPAEWVEHLAPLQDTCPPMQLDEVKAVVQSGLLGGASLEATFERFDPVPLGAASIAQVHSARLTREAAQEANRSHRRRRRRRRSSSSSSRLLWPWRARGSGRGPQDGGGSRFGCEVVVKVQRPGARELVLRDLATLQVFAKAVGQDISWDVDMIMTEVRQQSPSSQRITYFVSPSSSALVRLSFFFLFHVFPLLPSKRKRWLGT
mmetsp:Transcript_63244/g.142631  ORF Transcript_63244/g.142631 Transcript_63244/m.142631 type:complete len:286 (+) Transcript_63244:61-918(+)